MEAEEKLKQHFLANTTITLCYGKQKAFSSLIGLFNSNGHRCRR